MKQLKLFCLIMAAAMSLTLAAQVSSNPSPIPVGYGGSITLTFDPLKGDGGMKNATECYSHIGLITAESNGNIHEWQYIKNNAWGTKSAPKWTATSDGKWQLTISNLYSYFGCTTQTNITAIVMVMHDGAGKDNKNLKTGRAANGSDILVFIGKGRLHPRRSDYAHPSGQCGPRHLLRRRRHVGDPVHLCRRQTGSRVQHPHTR